MRNVERERERERGREKEQEREDGCEDRASAKMKKIKKSHRSKKKFVEKKPLSPSLSLSRSLSSPVVVQPLVVEVDDVRRDRVQEASVVRDDDQRLLPAGEVLFEPEHGAEVEVVGRLIEFFFFAVGVA